MSQSENILQTVKTALQDVVAPDVRDLKARVTSLDDTIKVRFDALDSKMDAQFKALLAAIAQNKAENELKTLQLLGELRERVAVLEARHQ